MKITIQQLKRIIKEEVEKQAKIALQEASYDEQTGLPLDKEAAWAIAFDLKEKFEDMKDDYFSPAEKEFVIHGIFGDRHDELETIVEAFLNHCRFGMNPKR